MKARDVEAGTEGQALAGSEVPATISWKQLTVEAANVNGDVKTILNGVCGCVLPTQMLAIMGPSGCGKTTLLDTLAGRPPKKVTIKGQVLLNGRESNLSYGVSAYVTQDEQLVGVLSVRETLVYAALMRLPASMPYSAKMERVEEIIRLMGLTDAQDTKIGNWFLKGISGGQKRRVSIGCEMVTHPSLMFLDEPTSGLDAASAFYVMDTIRKLAATGRTILTVIHQPSSEVFELFQYLALLSSGNTVYFGPAEKAIDMFAAVGLPCPNSRSASDHFLHVINQDFKGDDKHAEDVQNNIKLLINHYNTEVQPQVMSTLAEHCTPEGPAYTGNTNQANYFYQTAVLTHRTFLNNLRNVGVFWLRLGMYLGLCICIGTIFLKLGDEWKDTYSRAAMLFFIVAFLTFMSISGFPSFVEDMLVFMRERLNGYYEVSSFVISNTLASVPFVFLIAFLSSCVVYWLVGLNDEGDRFPYFFMNLFVSLLVVESLMMAIAAIVPHYLMGIAAGAGIMGMMMLVCGFFQPVGSIPQPVWRYPLHYIGYHSYTFSGFMHNEFDGTSGWGCPCVDQKSGCGAEFEPPNAPCSVSGQEVLDYWMTGSLSKLNKWVDVAIQIAMIGGYRFIFWALLVLKEWMHTH